MIYTAEDIFSPFRILWCPRGDVYDGITEPSFGDVWYEVIYPGLKIMWIEVIISFYLVAL